MSEVVVRHDDAAAYITLNRPGAGNAIDPALAEGLAAAASDVSSDPSIRCVVLTGTGRIFCAGGDVGGMAAAGDQAPQFLRSLADTLHSAVDTLSTMAKPLVVLVNGPAAGAGLSLAVLGDVVVAARSAHFTAAYTGIGLTPDGGMSWLLPRVVGLRRAQSMILTNRRVSAEEAENWGLVSHVVADEDVLPEGKRIVDRLVASPTAAIGSARRLLAEGATSTFRAQLDREAETISAAGGGAESREGVSAFLARRTPDFRGGRHG